MKHDPNTQMVVSARVCRDCGAVYSTPGGTTMHKRATGHESFKTVRRVVDRKPSVIMYNPALGRIEQNHA